MDSLTNREETLGFLVATQLSFTKIHEQLKINRLATRPVTA